MCPVSAPSFPICLLHYELAYLSTSFLEVTRLFFFCLHVVTLLLLPGIPFLLLPSSLFPPCPADSWSFISFCTRSVSTPTHRQSPHAGVAAPLLTHSSGVSVGHLLACRSRPRRGGPFTPLPPLLRAPGSRTLLDSLPAASGWVVDEVHV